MSTWIIVMLIGFCHIGSQQEEFPHMCMQGGQAMKEAWEGRDPTEWRCDLALIWAFEKLEVMLGFISPSRPFSINDNLWFVGACSLPTTMDRVQNDTHSTWPRLSSFAIWHMLDWLERCHSMSFQYPHDPPSSFWSKLGGH